jgi:hypothetical protein
MSDSPELLTHSQVDQVLDMVMEKAMVMEKGMAMEEFLRTFPWLYCKQGNWRPGNHLM